jgi:hypothetical protein
MVGLMILFLSWSDPLVLKFPPFMLDVREVVDSPAESSKCVATQIREVPEAMFKTREMGLCDFRNQSLRFCRDRRQSGAPPSFDEVHLL